MDSTTDERASLESMPYRLLVLFILFLHYTLNYLDRQILSILAVPIQSELSLSDTQLGLLGGLAFAIFYSTLGIPLALLADRIDRKAMLATALALWSGFTALCGLAANFWQLFLCRLFVGIGEAGGTAPAISLLSDYFPPHQRGRALAVFISGVPIGSALGLVLGGYVSVHFGWRLAFLAVALPGLFLSPVMWFLIREPKRGRLDYGSPAVTSERPLVGEIFSYLLKLPSFWLLSFGTSAATMTMYGFGFWLPSFFQRSYSLGLQDVALVMAALVLIGGLLGNVLGGWLGDKLGSSRRGFYAYVPCIAFLIGLPFLMGALWVQNIEAAFALFIIPQACAVIAHSPVSTAIQHLGPPSMRTTIVASYLFVINLMGAGLGVVMVGGLSDLLGQQFGQESLRYTLLACGLVLYPLAALLYFFAGKRLPRDWYQPQ